MKKEEPKFISLAEAAKLTNYSQDYISLLCRQGKLRAEKLGRNWVTTKEWVYSYVDNTEGKGESVVPVKIKTVSAEKEHKEEKKHKEKKNFFYGQSVLEGTFFCFACLIWSINIFLFVDYWNQGDFGQDALAIVDDYSSSKTPSNQSENINYSQTEKQGDSSGEDKVLLAFDKETDPSIIEQRMSEIKAALGQDVDAEIYNGFAIISYENDPAKKFVYLLN